MEKMYTVGQFARLTGVTERTLRYYDRKGLLKPSCYNDIGHRLYKEEDLWEVQKILTLKYLNYSLDAIADFKKQPEKSIKETLLFQKQLLEKKRNEIEHVIQSISKAEELVQNDQIDNDLLLSLIHTYQHEDAHKQWFSQYLSREAVNHLFFTGKPEEERLHLERQVTGLLSKISSLSKHKQPDDPEVQEVVKQFYEIINSFIKPEIYDEFSKLDLSPLRAEPFPLSTLFNPDLEKFLHDAVAVLDNTGEEPLA